MIEPIGWLRTLQFVATDACVTPRCRGRGHHPPFREKTDACVRARHTAIPVERPINHKICI